MTDRTKPTVSPLPAGPVIVTEHATPHAAQVRYWARVMRPPPGLNLDIYGQAEKELTAAADRLEKLERVLRMLREAALDVFGDPEDCDDCTELDSTGTACRIHSASPLANNLIKAITATEDALGPCECGHARAAHNEDDLRPCRSCHCRNFRLHAPRLREEEK